MDFVVKYDLNVGDKHAGCQHAAISMNYYITYRALARINYAVCLGVISHLYSVSVFILSA